MQNKGNCRREQGFVPVTGNWDFNMERGSGCQQEYARQANYRHDCPSRDKEYVREREDNDCQCERCDDNRRVICCAPNTYLRDMENCGYAAEQRCPRKDCDDQADCPCQNTAPNRRRCNDCDECQESTVPYRTGCGECDECRENTASARQQERGCARKNRHVGMVNVDKQEIDEIFESESALRAGTLFPELHKPLNGYCPCDSNCATGKQAAAFAAWEMRLYLNTHPHDEEALALFARLCREAGDENYATTFLTDECCTSAWNWVKNPWPWEYSCRCGDEKPNCGCRNGNA